MMTGENNTRESRAAAFRLLAETARQMAETADSEMVREDYLRIAAGWLQLANDIENSKQ
jgi:hypothetical protein